MNIALNDGYRLTEIRRTDRPEVVEFLNDRAIHEQTLRLPFPYTEADADRWFAIVERLTEQNGRPVNWAIRDDVGRLMGGVGLDGHLIGASHAAEIAYWLARPAWGRGIMTAAVSAACRHAFDEFGLEKIVAHVFATNAASSRVLEKCGFELEGYLKRHFLKAGAFIDARRYGLLRLNTDRPSGPETQASRA